MKKSISLLAISVILIALFFSGCKKGENDPFLTLKSRTARLAQDWVLSSEDYTVTQTGTWLGVGDYITTIVYSFDGTSESQKATQSSGGNSTTNTTTYTYSKEITFDKDGTFKSTEINGGNATITEGTWMWMSKNKNNDLKNKEAIAMFITKQTDSNGNTDTYGGKSNFNLNGVVVFDKLTSDEVVMKFDFTETDSDGDTHTMTGTQTFTKK